MNCPQCNSKTKIIDTRKAGDRIIVCKEHQYSGEKIRRRHQCKCGVRFTTIEVLCEILPPKYPENRVVKPKQKQNKMPGNDWLEKINRKLNQ